MKVVFKHPRYFGKAKFSKGIHEVSDEIVKSSYFAALAKLGDVAIMVEPPAAKAEPSDEVGDESPSEDEPKSKKKK